MFRTLLVLILALLLSAGGDFARSWLVVDSPAHAAQAGNDCCPHGAAQPDEDGGRCDLDCGNPCCAAGLVALSPAEARGLQLRTVVHDHRVALPAELLPDHDTGPPPTPPPIG